MVIDRSCIAMAALGLLLSMGLLTAVAQDSGLGTKVGSPVLDGVPPAAANRVNQLVVGTFELLQVDPNPVGPNDIFSIVYRIKNFRPAPLGVVVKSVTDLPASQTVTLAPGETRVGELSGLFHAAGA